MFPPGHFTDNGECGGNQRKSRTLVVW